MGWWSLPTLPCSQMLEDHQRPLWLTSEARPWRASSFFWHPLGTPELGPAKSNWHGACSLHHHPALPCSPVRCSKDHRSSSSPTMLPSIIAGTSEPTSSPCLRGPPQRAPTRNATGLARSRCRGSGGLPGHPGGRSQGRDPGTGDWRPHPTLPPKPATSRVSTGQKNSKRMA